MFGVITDLSVSVCKDADEAQEKGHVYHGKEKPTKLLNVKNVVVVRHGTTTGNSTVDFVMEDQQGNEYVFMISGNVLKSIPC